MDLIQKLELEETGDGADKEWMHSCEMGHLSQVLIPLSWRGNGQLGLDSVKPTLLDEYSCPKLWT